MKTRLFPFLLALALMAEGAFASCAEDMAAPDPRRQMTEKVVSEFLPQAMDVFAKISRQYPMATHEFVLMGASPALVAAYLEAQQEMYPSLRFWVLPLSLAREQTASPGVVQKRFNKILQLFRGAAGLTAFDRKLVVVDSVHDGRTFGVLDRLFSSIEAPVEFVGFSPDPVTAKEKLAGQMRAHAFNVIPVAAEVEDSLGQHKFVRPYDSLAIGDKNFNNQQVIDPKAKSPTYRWAVDFVKEELGF